MRIVNNPFLLIGYRGKSYFCNRKDELKWLSDNVKNDRNSVLYSWRRLGKSALIKCFLAEQEKSKKADCIYVDLLATRDIRESIKQIAQSVIDRYGKTESGFGAAMRNLLGKIGFDVGFDPVTGLPSLSLGLRHEPVPEQSLHALGEFLSEQKKQVIIALDEFQQVATFGAENGEAVFRLWAQEFPQIRFIYSGSHRQMMSSMFSEKNRPFYRSAQLLELHPINLKDYRQFIRKHFSAHNKKIDSDTIEAIYEWSRGQTYCIQLICNRLFGQYDDVKKQYLHTIYQEILEQENTVFSNYFNLLTETQWNVLRAVAKEEPMINPFSKKILTRYRLGAASSVSSAMQQLQTKELVIKDGNSFLVHDVIFARWLQNR